MTQNYERDSLAPMANLCLHFVLVIIPSSCQHWKNSFLECLCSWGLTCKWVHFQAYKANKIASGQGSPWNSLKLCSIWRSPGQDAHLGMHMGQRPVGEQAVISRPLRTQGHLNGETTALFSLLFYLPLLFFLTPFYFLTSPTKFVQIKWRL